jgi:alkylation response protein AidB-like acyl-CoA dehydrogenase
VLEPHPDSIALRGFSYGKIRFDECRVPAANTLGVEGGGLEVAYSSSLIYGRPNLTAVALGIHRAVNDQIVEFCRSQHRKGRPLYELPTVKEKLGRIHSLWLTARVAAYHAAHLLDRGVPCDAELMSAKAVGVENLQESIDLAMVIYGAPGLAADRRMDRLWSDAQAMRPPAGTSGVQYLRLAEMAVGNGRRPWSDIHRETTLAHGAW